MSTRRNKKSSHEGVDRCRRALFKAAALAGLAPQSALVLATETPAPGHALGAGMLHFLSDGHLALPVTLPEDAQVAAEMKTLLESAGLSTERYEPPCNVTLWQTDDRLVLFDIGAGTQFMDTVGQLPMQLETLGIDPADITDVVFTHAHPDHCWGLIDDFDELFCPNATYHINQAEYDYWMSDKTLNETPEARLGMVAGARNRLPLIESQLTFFTWGDEVLPGIEAVDTHGHTPGHTAFAVHQGSESVMVIGDALSHPVFSFQRPMWHRSNDIDPAVAAQTRASLLDRLTADKTPVVAFHMPDGGFGHVERSDSQFRFVPQSA